MKYLIVKEKRKTICIKLKNANEVLVKAPLNISDAKVQEFIASKLSWIEKQASNILQEEMFASTFDLENNIYRFGKPILSVDSLSLTKMSVSKRIKAIKLQYFDMFDYLKCRGEELAKLYNIEVKKIEPMISVCKWGSFSSAKEMKLNYKLIILPKELIDYVIIHELCHSRHMNHKPQFWQEVKKFCPDYKILRKRLQNYSFILKNKAIR